MMAEDFKSDFQCSISFKINYLNTAVMKPSVKKWPVCNYTLNLTWTKGALLLQGLMLLINGP